MPAKKPLPVTLADTPVPVVLAEEAHEKRLVDAKAGGVALAPNTTEQEDIVTAGQRRINLIWELTQAAIAVTITGSMVFAALNGIDSDVLKNAFFLIVGFYFSRTNHQSIGGVGRKASEGPFSRR